MASASPATQQHIDEKHPRQLLDVMASLWMRRDLCDIALVVGEREIAAHKVVLSAASPYFRAMFTGEMSESKQSRVVIRDVSYEAMAMLVNYAYTAKINIGEDNVQALLSAACLLQLNGVISVCCEFLIRQLDASNCLGFSDFAERHNCRELQVAADKCTLQHFQTVADGEEFLMLPPEHLARLLASDELNVQSEEQVWELALCWAKHDIHSRRQHLALVMQNVRFCQFTPKFLVNRVSSEPLMKSDNICRDLIDEAKNSHLVPDYQSRLRTTHVQPRRPVQDSQVMYAVGGWCSGDAINTVERFDAVNNEWCVVAAMAKRRCGVGVTVLNGCVYALGGHDGASYLNSIERYNPRTNQWYSDVAPTSTCRTSVGVAVLKNMIYAVGGQDGISCLNIVEKYDPAKNKWQRVAPMSARRLGVAVAVVNDLLYAVGGSDGTSPLYTVEKYDPGSNTWTVCAPMCSPRKHLGVAVLGNCLYATGGRDDTSELNTVERYDPGANQWFPVASMMSRRSGVGLAAVNGKLYGVGGFDGSTYLKSVECLDVAANQWKPAAPMNYRRLGGGVGVIDTMCTPSGLEQ